MDIEEFINVMELRPQMYVYPTKIDYIYYFLSGYVGSVKCNVPYSVDINVAFFAQFGKWMVQWVVNNVDRNYQQKETFWYQMFYDVTSNEEDAVKLFFKLSKEFFTQYHNGEL